MAKPFRLWTQTEELPSSLVSLALLKGSLVWNVVSFLVYVAPADGAWCRRAG